MKERSLPTPDLIRLWTLVVVRIVLLLICFALVVWVLYTLGTVLLLLVLSVFFCYLIAPLVRLFEQPIYIKGREIKMPRGVAIALVYSLLGVLLFGSVQLIMPILWEQLTELAQRLPDYIASASAGVSKTFNDANSWMRHVRLPRQWRDYLISQSSHLAESILPWLQALVLKILSYLKYLPWLILVPVISFFLLKDAESFEQSVVRLMPERLQKRAHWLLLDVSRTLAAYIRAQITACLVVGALVTAGFGIMGVPYALVLGFISAVLEFVPLIGPLLAAIIAFSLTMTTSFKMALVVALFLAVLRIVQDYIIYPRIIGQGIKMHPLVVVIAILAGAEIGGLSGIFLAIPFVGLFIVGYNHYLAYRGMRDLQEGAVVGEVTPDPKAEICPPPESPPESGELASNDVVTISER